MLIPTGRSCEDARLVAASMIPVTQRLKFRWHCVRAWFPTVAARQAATLDRLSNGRALFNPVTGSDPQELAGDGVFLDHTERYEASAEFTRVWRRLLEGKRSPSMASIFMFATRNSTFLRYSSRVHRSTSADRRMWQDLAAEQVDLYLTGEPPELVKEKIARCRPKPPPTAARCALAFACT